MKSLLERGRGFVKTSFKFTGFHAFGLVALLGLAGCQTPAYQPVNDPKTRPSLLREGDVLTISFPGAPTLNTVQHVGRDGKITLSQVGDVVAAGKTANELEKELIQRYAGKLVSNSVTISVQSSSYSVYVTGAVLRPGKLTTDRSMTALEAVMEAGVDHNRANLKAVKVTRIVSDRTEHFTLNLKRILDGGEGQPFYLEPGDVVYVPEKFSWL